MMGTGDPLRQVVTGLFNIPVAVGIADPRQNYGPLAPEEQVAIRRAGQKRRRAFTAGRVAARGALAALGQFNRPVTSGQDRAPRWPDGFTGSISHSPHIGLAVVAETARARALGIDVEPKEPLGRELIPLICDATETDWLDTRPEGERGHWAKLIFSAKEAAYKCQYPLTGTLLGFEAFHITFTPGNRFFAEFRKGVGCFRAGARLHGRFALAQGHMLTAVAA